MIKPRFTTEEYLYFLGYALYILAASFLGNVLSPLSKLTKILSILLMAAGCVLGIRILRPGEMLRNVLILCSVLLVALLLDMKLAVLFIFVYAFSNCRFDTLIRIDFAVRLFGFLATCLLCWQGVIDDYILGTYRPSGLLIFRHSLGFPHPNTCFLMVFIILVDFLLIRFMRNGRTSLLDTLLVIVIACIFSRLTNSRAGTALTIFFAIAMFLHTQFRLLHRFRWIARILCYSAVLCFVLSFVLVLIYRHIPSLGEKLNIILTNRISSMAYFLDSYGVNILPTLTERISTREAAETGVRALVLDNLYANLFISYGLVFSAAYLYLQAATCRMLVRAQRYEYLLVFAVIAVYGIVEGMPLNLDFNYFLVLARFALFPSMDRSLLIPQSVDRWRWA